jgi:hypothetical protein
VPLAAYAASCEACRRGACTTEPESPGLKRLVEIAHDCEPVDLIALRRFGLEDASLQPGERFECERGMVSELVRAGFAKRIANRS